MPYSDPPPEMVVPDTRWGRELAARDFRPEGIVTTVCNRYTPRKRGWVETDDDALRPFDVEFCNNRDRSGSRWHNHCFRCVSGFPHAFVETTHENETGWDTALSL